MARVSDRPRARTDLLFRDLADGCALYDPVHDRVHVLNPTAGLVWTACDGEHSIDEMVRLVMGAVNVPEDIVRKDVEGTVADFIRLGLVE